MKYTLVNATEKRAIESDEVPFSPISDMLTDWYNNNYTPVQWVELYNRYAQAHGKSIIYPNNEEGLNSISSNNIKEYTANVSCKSSHYNPYNDYVIQLPDGRIQSFNDLWEISETLNVTDKHLIIFDIH